MNFIDKKITVNQAIAILAKNNIDADENDTIVILDFLYLIAKNTNKVEGKIGESLRTNRTSKKLR
ncbi:MAG: PTS sugar transporter subunit IIBC [Bacteroidetes bacterium 43-16]|nr:MAG: PTS sugar transporter subunit IIBC [Bacteroidetes bacterium 43-16]